MVIILDSNTDAHRTWDTKFANILNKVPTIQVKHYDKASEALNFIESLSEQDKKHVYVLIDHEFVNEASCGLAIIEKARHSTILTPGYLIDARLRKFATQSRVKILPNELVSSIAFKML